MVIGKFLHAHFELLAVQGVHGADFEERLKLLAEIWPRLLILLLLFLLLCLSRYDNLEHASLPRTTVHITTLFSSSESLPCIILNSCRFGILVQLPSWGLPGEAARGPRPLLLELRLKYVLCCCLLLRLSAQLNRLD